MVGRVGPVRETYFLPFFLDHNILSLSLSLSLARSLARSLASSLVKILSRENQDKRRCKAADTILKQL
jgi:hypothetical protein